MIHICIEQPCSESWLKWRSESEMETAQVISAFKGGSDRPIRAELYRREKDRIKRIFHGKCAYCECPIVADQYGDIDHFRPKAGITHVDGAPVQITVEGEARVHPGYYWLAYDWTNLLPTCVRCNRLSKFHDRTIGKGTRFPVREFRATEPGDEAREEPMLLHPYLDEPDEHLEYKPSTGVIVGKTDRGEVTIEILGLNREGLPEARRRAYTQVRRALQELGYNLGGGSEIGDGCYQEVSEFVSGEANYSLAGRKAIEDCRPGLRQLSEFLRRFAGL